MSALWLLKKVRASDMQLAPTCHMLIKKMQTIIINVNNLASKSQLEAQRSGCELERRSKGAERSFKAAPKGAALKRSGADFAPTWCGHGDLNPNALLHENLNLACLPIPSCPR